ncbi:monocarboxylate transporter 12-like [Lytechinus variegatus]|uniref:monocarboxylate transporter 12-like n=1 Tax=Lytechinus variegatus TaxID=7654 RepID=UPI001BB12251|nr:monocarboxylate transporter 12-like [Lytechinus variegatus]
MAEKLLEDSTDPWKYAILFSKFLLFFIDGGITKSFGVLLPDVVARYNSDFKTVALVLGLPSTIMFFTAPITIFLMKIMTLTTMATIGGLLSALPIICAPWAPSVYILGMMLAVTGFGMALTFFPLLVSMNRFFCKSFIFANTLTLFGTTCGAFLVPVIIERSLEAYGYAGGFLILGGIALHAVVCGALVRAPRERRRDNFNSPDSDIAERDSLMAVPVSDQSEMEQTHRRNTSIILQETVEESRSEEDKAMSSGNDSWCSCDSFLAQLKSFLFLHEPLYIVIAPAMVLQCFVQVGWMLFLVPHAEGAGIDQSNAVFLSSIAGISGIFGRILYLILLHLKRDNTTIFCFACVICASSFFLDFVSSSYIFLAGMASVQGFTVFIIDCLPHAMMKISIQNEENMPRAIATNSFLVGIGFLSGAVLSGYIYDVTSSFRVLFAVYGVLLLIITINLIIFKLIVRRKPRE